MVMLTLPYPPSINHYWRHFRGRMVISPEGRAFRANVCALLAQGSGSGPRRPLGGRIALSMDAFPPDRRRRDLDNLQKGLLDALEYAAIYEDDSQIDLLVTRRREVTKPGYIQIQLAELPWKRCPLCGGPSQPENT